jgi:hypothetical protein
MQEKSLLAQPEPLMPELIADRAHAGMLAGAKADVATVHSRMEKKRRFMAAYDSARQLIL